jgi:hypothetical protein
MYKKRTVPDALMTQNWLNSQRSALLFSPGLPLSVVAVLTQLILDLTGWIWNVESLWHAQYQGEQIHCDCEHADFINNVVLTWIWIWIISSRESQSWLYFAAPSAVNLLLLLLWGWIIFVFWKRQMNTAPKPRLHFSLSQDLFDKSRFEERSMDKASSLLFGFIIVLAYA